MENLVLVVSEGSHVSSYYYPFQKFGKYTNNVELLKSEEGSAAVALVVFTGGEDVTPSYYGEEASHLTWNNPHRDAFEKEVWDLAQLRKKPIAGICRGSQFICAMSGGKLAQDITGHGRYHNLRTDDGRLIYVSSTHHQMQIPPDDAVPIAWAEPKLSKHYLGAPGQVFTPDREHDVVWYPKTNALGMQYHPEYMKEDSDGFKYCGELVERFFKLPKLK